MVLMVVLSVVGLCGFFCEGGEETGRFTVYAVGGEKVVRDPDTGLLWTYDFVSQKEWEEAVEYCRNLSYAGIYDWRLPTQREQLTLVDRRRKHPASFFPKMPSDWFWSSTKDEKNPRAVKLVYFMYGFEESYYPDDNKFNVRCVYKETGAR